jgi:DNA-binding NtrC family response regulator
MSTDIGFRLSALANEHVVMGLEFSDALEAWRRELIRATLEKCRGNQLAAAALIGIHRNTLSRMMQNLGIRIEHRNQQQRRQPRKVIVFDHARDKAGSL